MSSEKLFEQVEKRVRHADKLVRKRRYDEAQAIYEQAASFYRDVRESQRVSVPGQSVPLTLRLMLANSYLIVPLDRLGELHLAQGRGTEACRCFREVVECLEEAAANAGGKSKADFEAKLAVARRTLAEAQATRGIADVATYERRYQETMALVAPMPRVLAEATLLLARRLLQLPPERFGDAKLETAELRRAIADAASISGGAPMTLADVERVAATDGTTIVSVAKRVADVHREHPELVI